MPDITITDSVHATANIEFNGASPLGFAKLTSLNFNGLPVIGEFTKPVDKCSLQHAEFGPTFIAPAALLSTATTFNVQGSANGSVSIRNEESKTLFEEDGFCPQIPIQPGECWIGLDLQLELQAKAGAAFNGFGVAANGTSDIAVGTYVLLKDGSSGLPSLRDALKIAFESYSAERTAESIRTQPVGIAYTLDTSGSIKFSGSYSLPIAVNPLASANLPFNYKISLDPDVSVRVGGEITLNGQFVIRSYKVAESDLILGVYKKKNSTLKATFEAGAGIRAEIGETDLTGAFLDAVFPAVDPVAAGLTEEQAKTFASALEDCVDHSLSVAANAACSASTTDESAVVYSIHLAADNPVITQQAIASALEGDWTRLAALPNSTVLRNICREIHERKHTIAVNLFGFYNAGSITDYVKASTILHDANGQLVLIDKTSAKHIATASMPHLADAEKLRSALAEEFIATVTYGASAAEDAQMKNFKVQQNYANYQAKTTAEGLRGQLLLGRALHLIPDMVWNETSDSAAPFFHIKTWVNASYDTAAVLRLFFADPAARTAYSRVQLERVGRNAKIALLTDTGPRLTALQSDEVWNAMTLIGNTSAFKTIPQLAQVSDVNLQVIAADWYDIIWWAKAMIAVAPALQQVLRTSSASDRKTLQDALAKAAAKARSAFGDGWGLLTMYLLSGGAPKVEMEVGWNGKFQHFPVAAQISKAVA